MENADAHQLPEVDSLPDGFVDSSEPPAPHTNTMVQEKPLTDHKDDGILDFSHSNKSKACQRSNENTSKQRTFPVPLREADGFEESTDASECLAEVSNGGLLEQGDSTLPLPLPLPDLDNTVSNGFTDVASSEVKGVPASHQSSERSSEGASVGQAEKVKETPPMGNIQLPKGRPLEAVENKRKNAKKTSLSEKEILKFTLKYQQVLAERDAAITVRDKLESLCRELQRQNKVLMDECKRVSTEGQSMRLDLSARFQDAIKDVNTKLDEQKVECFSQLKENEMLRNKLTQLADQYTLAEQQFAQKLKQKSLELELADLKFKQQEEKLIQEQSQIKVYADQVSQLLATEKTLRLQLTTDGEKFQQFQEALMKSNEVFETFKQEIEKMAKSIKDLKKENLLLKRKCEKSDATHMENLFLKSKCEKSDATLRELVEEREKLKRQLEKTKNQKEKLESLCRSLEAERKQKSTSSNCSDTVPV